ncbi:hypothetical protein [uncultured Microbacterium sp.]|uniref:hypothetical protein n=1 Tax=uncultured Microbacterium sp. TaxID=191216 RepID=UPI0025E5EAD0|nr:hypothetical protein [uncultured Microbacterium sp.]
MIPPPPSSLLVDAVGVKVRIDLTELSGTDRRAVESAWAGALAVDDAGPDTVVRLVRPDSTDRMLSQLSGAVTQDAIRARRGSSWMLHAGGVAAPDGGVVALVGASGAGKTTATRRLARTWAYVSDETIGIDPDGRVHAYRKPLSVITPGHPVKLQHCPASLGLRPLPDAALRLRRIVLLDRAERHREARLVPVDPAEALIALAPHSSALAAMPHPLTTAAGLLAATRGLWRAEYAEADDLDALVGAILLRDDDHEASLSVVAPEPPHPSAGDAATAVTHAASSDASTGGPTIGARRFLRAPVVEVLPFPPDRLAVLTASGDGAGLLHLLAGAAPALWHAADAATREELIRAVTDGPVHRDAREAIDGILDQLVEAGILTVA